jgi:DNA polymerase-1
MWAVAKKQYNEPSSALYGSRTVNFIHDELLVEVPEDRAAEAAGELQSTIVEAFNPWVPNHPVTAGVALMHRWSKEAEAVYNAAGELIPWLESMAA